MDLQIQKLSKKHLPMVQCHLVKILKKELSPNFKNRRQFFF